MSFNESSPNESDSAHDDDSPFVIAALPDSNGSFAEGGRARSFLTLRGRRPWRTLTIVLFVGLVVAPLLFWGVKTEMGRWYEAAFENAKYAGDMPLALKKLEQAIARCPNRPDLLVEQAQLLMRMRDYDSALAIADDLVDQSRRQQQMKPGDTLLQQQLALHLNMRAYYRAVADRENAKGLTDIEEAFVLMGDDLDPSMRDTRGYLYYRLGKYESAIADLDYALPLIKRSTMLDLANFQKVVQESATLPADSQRLDYLQASLRESLGVLYQHHALVLEKLDRKKAARRDFERARQYGYDPNKGSL